MVLANPRSQGRISHSFLLFNSHIVWDESLRLNYVKCLNECHTVKAASPDSLLGRGLRSEVLPGKGPYGVSGFVLVVWSSAPTAFTVPAAPRLQPVGMLAVIAEGNSTPSVELTQNHPGGFQMKAKRASPEPLSWPRK